MATKSNPSWYKLDDPQPESYDSVQNTPQIQNFLNKNYLSDAIGSSANNPSWRSQLGNSSNGSYLNSALSNNANLPAKSSTNINYNDMFVDVPITPKKTGYELYKANNPNTPDLLKPLGYALETPFRVPILKDILGAAARTIGGDNAIASDAPINQYGTGTGNKVVDTATNLLGSALGLGLTPINGLGTNQGTNLLNATDNLAARASTKVANKLPNDLPSWASSIVQGATKGVVEGSTGNALNSLRLNENASDILKSAGEGALGGAVLGGGLSALGQASSKLTPKLQDLITTSENTTYSGIKNPTGQLQPSWLQKNTNIPSESNVAQKPLNLDLIPSMNKTLNAKIEEPNLNTTLQLPSENLKETSKFKTNTWRNAPMLDSKEAQKVIDNIHAIYEVKPNMQSVSRAMEDLNNNYDEVVNRIREADSLTSAEDATASGIITKNLTQEASQTGDYSKLKNWLETIQPKVTNTAQSLQALSTWKKLTPEGALMKAQQVVGKVNRDGLEQFGKKFKKVDLTEDEMKFINDTMNNVQNMPDGRAKDIEFAKVKQAIADKIPPTLADKVGSLQRISLLLNTKTMARNILGNVVMGGLETAKDIPGSIIDKGLSKITGERTTLIPSLDTLTTQGKGFKKGVQEALQDYKLGVSTSPSSGQYDIPQANSFKNGVLGKLEKITNTGLELGDRPFWQGAYDESIRQLLKINKVDAPTEEMITKAKQAADERTFQNVSKMVNGFKSLQKGLNKIAGNEKLGLGNFVLPFTKTPANILDKAVDYSPAGGLKGIYNLTQGLRRGNLDQKKVVDQLGRSLTGSSLIALGYKMAKDGLLTGKANDDKDVANLEKQVGKNPYSIKVGDTYQTIDWAQPAAIPLMIGADIFHQGKTQADLNSTIVAAVKSGSSTLFQQSLLQGVQKLFGGYNPVQSATDAAAQIPGQFIPSGLKQIAQLTDKTQRNSFSPSYLENNILNPIKAKIPELSKTLQPRVDTLGRETPQFGGSRGAKYGFDVLLNPGYTNTYKPNPVEKELLSIYNETGNKDIFPKVADKKITYKGETINFTPQELTDFQKYIGQNTNEEMQKTISSQYYQNLSNEKKAKELEKIIQEWYDKGKKEFIYRRKK